MLTRSFSVGAFVCTMTLSTPKAGSVMSAAMEWSPSVPSSLTADQWREYRAGRNQALAEMAAELGVSAAVLEL